MPVENETEVIALHIYVAHLARILMPAKHLYAIPIILAECHPIDQS